jgi:hypothetical protein
MAVVIRPISIPTYPSSYSSTRYPFTSSSLSPSSSSNKPSTTSMPHMATPVRVASSSSLFVSPSPTTLKRKHSLTGNGASPTIVTTIETKTNGHRQPQPPASTSSLPSPSKRVTSDASPKQTMTLASPSKPKTNNDNSNGSNKKTKVASSTKQNNGNVSTPTKATSSSSSSMMVTPSTILTECPEHHLKLEARMWLSAEVVWLCPHDEVVIFD